jgi:hypothetical protein
MKNALVRGGAALGLAFAVASVPSYGDSVYSYHLYHDADPVTGTVVATPTTDVSIDVYLREVAPLTSSTLDAFGGLSSAGFNVKNVAVSPPAGSALFASPTPVSLNLAFDNPLPEFTGYTLTDGVLAAFMSVDIMASSAPAVSPIADTSNDIREVYLGTLHVTAGTSPTTFSVFMLDFPQFAFFAPDPDLLQPPIDPAAAASFTIAPSLDVPEPATLGLCLMGGAALLMRRRR